MSDFDVSMFDYKYDNLENSSFFPSTVHKSQNALTSYNFKYLFNRALSVLDFTIPKEWEKNFFLRALYTIGYLIIIDTEEFGVIPQVGTIWGYNIFYQPNKATVVNPVLDEKRIADKYRDMLIGKDCELLRLSPYYGGICDICEYYAELISTAETSLNTNLINSKMAFIFGAKRKNTAESLKRMYDDIASGNPATFVDKELFDENGNISVQMLEKDVKNTYIGSELLNDIRGILNDFDSMIGIPNTNLAKKERMIVDEANMNNFETKALCYVWIDQLKRDMDRINEKYNLDLSVNFRKDGENDVKSIDNNIDIV